MASSVEIIVRLNTGAYRTNSVRGIRASSTTCAHDAAWGFGRKYFPGGVLSVAHVNGDIWKVTGHSTTLQQVAS